MSSAFTIACRCAAASLRHGASGQAPQALKYSADYHRMARRACCLFTMLPMTIRHDASGFMRVSGLVLRRKVSASSRIFTRARRRSPRRLIAWHAEGTTTLSGFSRHRAQGRIEITIISSWPPGAAQAIISH